jgi:acyl carrier protein
MTHTISAAVRRWLPQRFLQQDVGNAVRRFLGETLCVREAGSFSADASLLAAGIIDSVNVLELMLFLETTFGIEIGDEEIVPENLDSIRSISGYVARKLRSRRLRRVA